MELGKYSFGTGDRFAHQGLAQLRGSMLAKEAGIEITHVWNKSFREHKTVKTSPNDVRKEADDAVKTLGWEGKYFVDADHINLTNVDQFINSSDFFTIDVADYIGKPAEAVKINAFIEDNKAYLGSISIPGIDEKFQVSEDWLRNFAGQFLYACEEAKNIFQHIAQKKGAENFVAEVSMDEVENPQSPLELFFILKALASLEVPLHTIAPKFTGRFNKGVDYVGDLDQFSKEFEEDILVIEYAKKEFGLPADLKLSVHSGSDKFSIYAPMNRLIKKHDAGLHVKTAGTTWLEELIGLAQAGGDALHLAKDIYAKALDRFDELTGPYATVIDVDKNQLPAPAEVENWSGEKYANSLRHDQDHPDYNPSLRQLLHCGYKIAAEYGSTYLHALEQHHQIIGKNVTENIFNRHIKPIFL